MRIEYKATRHRVNVNEVTGRRLVKAGIAREIVDPAPKAEPVKHVAEEAKPKRTYKRRDLQAEPVVTAEPAGSFQTRAVDEQAAE